MEKKKDLPVAGVREIIFYRTDSGDVKVEILLQDESLWLTQAKMAELFDVDRSVITKHIGNIISEHELNRESTCAIIAQVQTEGSRQVTRNIDYYNLDMIIAVGYRVNSKKATMFRIWATKVLKEFIIKGFSMDDERLRNPQYIFGKDYFDEQLARIRDIRSSERRLYQKITDIYSSCSADYDAESDITREFFATVQNKLHYAISGETAAEIIKKRANSKMPNMGLTSWKNAPDGKIRKTDVSIAKNYLDEKELDLFNRIVTMYLDYAELQAFEHRVMYMSDWVARLNEFLKFNHKDILEDSGKVSAEVAKIFAEGEYDKYRRIAGDSERSDFDQYLESARQEIPDVNE